MEQAAVPAPTGVVRIKRVHITHGPDQLRVDQTPPPVFYEIEDPWGRFKFEPDSRPWNDRLAPVFESARHDRIFVATSRSDVAAASGAEKDIGTARRYRRSLPAKLLICDLRFLSASCGHVASAGLLHYGVSS